MKLINSKVILYLIGSLWALGDVNAEILPASIPRAPESMLLDESNLFSPSHQFDLSSILKTFREDSGISAFVVTQYYVPDDDASSIGSTLLKAWTPDSAGILILHSRGNDRFSITANDAMEKVFTQAEMRSMIESAANGQRSATPLGVAGGLIASASTLTEAIAERISARKRHFHSAQIALLPLALTVGAALALLAVLVWFAARGIAKKRRRKNNFVFFPPVSLSPRFGASYGGGIVAEIGNTPALSPAPKPSPNSVSNPGHTPSLAPLSRR